MSKTHEIDPALKKLLDTLPSGNPDEGDQIEVRMPFAKNVHVVPARTRARLHFGPWYGPDLPVDKITLKARNLRTDNVKIFAFRLRSGESVVKKGMTMVVTWSGREV